MTLSSLDARKVITKHQKTTPIQVMPIAKELGLKVYTVGGWPEDVSGKILRDKERGGSSGYAIYVNALHAPVRRRFTIAHEIGHYVLHRSLIGDGVEDDGLYRSKLSGGIEAEANRFAAELLMPLPLLQNKLDAGEDSVANLAETFEVSKSSMSIRLGVPYEG